MNQQAQTEFAVVDVETTGLFVAWHDRVVEIGIVGLDEDGSPIDSWGTLVNPGRDLGPTGIHGIRGRDIVDAPTFSELVGDVSERLAGRVLVAHNARFDADFLKAEFTRCGYPFPEAPWLCTMELGSRLTGARGLQACCAALDIRHEKWHSAIDDAQAASSVLCRCLGRPDMRLLLAQVLAERPIPPRERWPIVQPCRRTTIRGEARRSAGANYLIGLLDRVPPSAVEHPGAEMAYLDVLDRVLEDRRVTLDEADGLREIAASWGLAVATVNDLHNRYLDDLVQAALRDAVVTSAERSDLEDVASLLTIEAAELAALLVRHAPSVPTSDLHTDSAQASLVGKTVCFTGQLTCTIRHLAITREAAQMYASEAGLVVLQNVTKKLDILVVADPDSLSGKARKARDFGTRIMVERAFWKAIGLDVD